MAVTENEFNAVRMPLQMGWFDLRPGGFPDSPEYAEILTSHCLPTGAIAFYDGLIRRVGELRVYVIPEFHELPANPCRYFVGGREQDRGTGKPGTAIARMAASDEAKKRYYADPDMERDLGSKLLWRWRPMSSFTPLSGDDSRLFL